MALVAADWTVTRSTGNIRYIGADHGGVSPSYATVIDFHRWLQDLADDAVATSDQDELDITNTLPSQRSTDNIITLINGYNIDDAASEHLYDGSIIQNTGDDVYDGIVNFGNADVQIQIIQNGAVLGDPWWNYNGAGLNADATSGISHRFMIQTRSGGTDVDGRKIIGICRRFNFTYSEFTINATARGNNVLALNDSSDLNNATDSATVAGWSADFSNTEGYVLLDVSNDLVADEPYYSEWTIGGVRTINDFYEYTKYLSRDGSASTLYGLSGQLFRGITHQVAISSPTGTFVEPELLSWGTGATAGTAQLLAIDSTTAGTKMWIQLLTGATPTGTITGAGAATATAGTVTERTIAKPFVGASTGSALIGSYGLGVTPLDLSANDSVTDLNTTPHNPPNNVTNTLTGLVSGEDRVLVAPRLGVDSNNDPAINKSQMTLNGNLTTDNITEVVVTSIPVATAYPPSTGYIRVTDNNGYERRLHYSAYSTGTNTFTISGGQYGDGNEDFFTVNATGAKNVYFAYIDVLATSDTASFTSVHADGAADMNLVIIVRDGGGTPIKQYIAPWTQSDSSASTAVIRTSDT